MATLTLKMENNFFVETRGVQSVYLKEPTHVVANGWDCNIHKDGTIECISTKEYSDGVHSLRYTISVDGFAKLTLKIPGSQIKTLKKGFVLPKGTKLSNGVIGLSGGKIDLRYAYFRNGGFQKFLEEHGISAVKHEDPNKKYLLRNALYGGGDCKASLYTDGKQQILCTDLGRSDKWWKESYGMTSASEKEELVEVSGATWVLHKQSQHEGDSCNCFCILYTMEKDPTKLVGIPNIKKNRSICGRLSVKGEEGFLTLEELEEALTKIEPRIEKKIKKQKIKFDFMYDRKSIRLSDGSKIVFSTEEDAKEAFFKFLNTRFEDIRELKKYLDEVGYRVEFTRYYAFPKLDEKENEIRIEVRSSTSNGKGFDSYMDNFWNVRLS